MCVSNVAREGAGMIHVSEKCTGCLTCALVCSLSHHEQCSPSLAYVRLHADGSRWRAEFTPDCDECGRCARYCPYGALEKEN